MFKSFPVTKISRRLSCPGSYNLERLAPRSEYTDAAKRGIELHTVLEHYVLTDVAPIAGTLYHGVTVDDEELKMLKVAYDSISPHGLKSGVQAETKVTIERLSALTNGRVDFWSYDYDDENMLTSLNVWDFKSGHYVVDEFENYQLICYALGLIELLESRGYYCSLAEVNLHVVQPSASYTDDVRTFSTDSATLMNVYAPILRSGEEAAQAKDAPCVVSRECLFCSARAQCSTLQKSAIDYAKFSKTGETYITNNTQLSHELTLLDDAMSTIKARVSGLEAEVVVRLQQGQRVSGFRMGRTTPREKWTCDDKEMKVLQELTGLDFTKPSEYITPKQAVALGLPEVLKDQYSINPPGSNKLERVTHNLLKKQFTNKRK